MSGNQLKEKEVRILVSACLVGEKVRYNGSDVPIDNKLFAVISEKCLLFPCCPELAGGLTVPRAPAEIEGDCGLVGGKAVLSGQARVKNAQGDDVTEAFKKGAESALQLCIEKRIGMAILTERSPSCGANMIYDGTFTGRKITAVGVTTALLRDNGIMVFSQNQLEEVQQTLAEL